MTTKELIERLQKEDPEGTSHIRGFEGIIIGVEAKEGYWDGPYDYFDDGDWVHSIRGTKVDIHSYSACEFVWDLVDCKYRDEKDLEEELWLKVKNRFRFELGDYSIESQAKERIDSFLTEVRGEFNYALQSIKNSSKKQLESSLEAAQSGWRWFQDKRVDEDKLYTHQRWKIYNKWGIREDSHIFSTNAVLYSGKWEKHDNKKKKGYYQWLLKT